MTNFAKQFRVDPKKKLKLNDVKTVWSGEGIDRKAAKDLVKEYKKTISVQQQKLYAERKHALLIVFQGIDAAGKDGIIKRVITGINPQGCSVTSFKEPTKDELEHDFLWRIHHHTPRRGSICVFNRSHYEDVLVARVHKLVEKAVWSQRYAQINQFEDLLVHASQTTILKFFLHISSQEQLRRFKDRLDDPLRQWKISDADYVERKFWSDYTDAYEDALVKTSTDDAPWFVIPADKKWFRDLAVAQIIAQTMEGMDLQLPEPLVDLAQIRREYHEASK